MSIIPLLSKNEVPINRPTASTMANVCTQERPRLFFTVILLVVQFISAFFYI